jgi:L-ascorbate metabolism protein UlaG (beta-lactamase superfamily)
VRITRLSWAGLLLEAAGQRLWLDLLVNPELFVPFGGEPSEALLAPAESGSTVGAAITHAHTDHFDPHTLSRLLDRGAPLVCPAETEAVVRAAFDSLGEAGLVVRGVHEWETIALGPFELTALPAVDGLGDPQVSWMIKAGEKQILHCGDTMWHGHWWAIRDRYGRPEFAFLPINAATVNYPHRQPASGLPAVMSPKEAAAAAEIVGARRTVPIHYGLYHHPPVYSAEGEAEALFLEEADSRGVEVRLMAPGDALEISAPAPDSS